MKSMRETTRSSECKLVAACVAAALLGGASAAHAEDDWHVLARFGLWATSIDGTASVRGRESEIDAGFDDLFDKTNFALAPGFEIGKGNWAFAFHGFFSQLESESVFPLLNRTGTTTLDTYIFDLALGYRVVDVPMGDKEDQRFSLTPVVGLRTSYFSTEMSIDGLPSVSKSQTLWDPFVGGRVNLAFNRQVAWRTEASIGGFGAGSDLTWTAQSFIDWRFHERIELNVGYRALYYDFENDDFELDLTMHGPWIGMSFYFK